VCVCWGGGCNSIFNINFHSYRGIKDGRLNHLTPIGFSSLKLPSAVYSCVIARMFTVPQFRVCAVSDPAGLDEHRLTRCSLFPQGLAHIHRSLRSLMSEAASTIGPIHRHHRTSAKQQRRRFCHTCVVGRNNVNTPGKTSWVVCMFYGINTGIGCCAVNTEVYTHLAYLYPRPSTYYPADGIALLELPQFLFLLFRIMASLPSRVGYRKPVPMWHRFQYNRYYPDRNATHIPVLPSGA